MPGLPGPGRPLDGTAGLPDLRLGGVFRRLTEPARQGALRGDRPPARPPSGAGIAVAMVLRPPASRLTRQAAARAAGFVSSLPFFMRLLEPRSELDNSHSGGRLRRRRAFPPERRSGPDGQQKTPGGGDRVDRWVAVRRAGCRGVAAVGTWTRVRRRA